MLYSLFILTVGIYLGQEYTNIPSIKNVVSNMTCMLSNKKSTQQENKQQENKQQEVVYKPGYSDKLLEMLRKYVA
jgi:hypothetical protein